MHGPARAVGVICLLTSFWYALCAGDDARSAKTSESRVIVYLDRPTRFGPAADEMTTPGILAQELVRQAFLMAAREELGLLTRDARWGDAMPSDGDNLPFAIVTKKDDPTRLEVRRGLPGQRDAIITHKLKKELDRWQLLREAVEMEDLSRTAFVEVLKKAGFSGKPLPQGSAAVPEAIGKLLNEMTFTSQFSAVRQLHKLAYEQGTSPAIWDALARGYSNLGMLTEKLLASGPQDVQGPGATLCAAQLRGR
jgi:hypothetical protein